MCQPLFPPSSFPHRPAAACGSRCAGFPRFLAAMAGYEPCRGEIYERRAHQPTTEPANSPRGSPGAPTIEYNRITGSHGAVLLGVRLPPCLASFLPPTLAWEAGGEAEGREEGNSRVLRYIHVGLQLHKLKTARPAHTKSVLMSLASPFLVPPSPIG
ncbi:hypothetical protein E2C01_040258 [Portunus trituberculatus]|uniref:Uncharacterized protein n=1 Tax=Portunus trituberculatus TaxID=210409 RepID=A0A5B7FNQ1_PORTR|nr:hypothetical protein [Portunus trituberculatus]